MTEFFEGATRIEFVVKDHDTVGANDTLGNILVKKRDLLDGDGERVEYSLNTSKKSNGTVLGGKKVGIIISSHRDKNLVRSSNG